METARANKVGVRKKIIPANVSVRAEKIKVIALLLPNQSDKTPATILPQALKNENKETIKNPWPKEN